MNHFQDDDDEQDPEKKSKFKNSKKTVDLSKLKRDKHAPQTTKTEDKQVKEDRVFKPVGKVTLGNKWGSEEVDVDKQLAMERLKQLDEQAKTEEVKPQKKEPKFVGKANIVDKTKEFDEAEKERHRIAQEKLKLIGEALPTKGVKIELVKEEPKEKRFKNTKREMDNGLKKRKHTEDNIAKSESISNKDNIPIINSVNGIESDKPIKVPLVISKPQTTNVQIATTTGNKW